MRYKRISTVAYTVMGLLGAAIPALAQISQSEIEKLDKLSQEKAESGAYRNHGLPVPQSNVPADQLHQPSGLWTCMGTSDYQPIYSAPTVSASQIGVSYGQVAAGRDQGTFTSVLFKEGVIGFVPKSAVHEYHNSLNPRATCTVAGIRSNGTVVYRIR